MFACAVALAAAERDRSSPGRTLTEALGLSGPSLRALAEAYFPSVVPDLMALAAGGDAGDDRGDDALEEPDLRALLVESGTCGAIEETWLAAVVARRSLGANHLWQDLGLPNRTDLSAALHRHFRPLAQRNDQDMKWKKFFYRQLCEREGVLVCKAPNCAICDDVGLCFGAESGDPLARFQDSRQP